jgi:hypothetical protein
MITLSLYTNCTSFNSNNSNLISTTFNSFINTFSLDYVNEIFVFIDPQPNTKNKELYYKEISNYFNKYKTDFRNIFIHFTKGLADGYLLSINKSKNDYIFQLEHDWTFNKDLIKHNITELIDSLKYNNIYYFRFNKRKTEVKLSDTYLNEKIYNNITFSETPSISNNPHIIDKNYYNKYVKEFINPDSKGSKGIEEILQKNKLKIGNIYGSINYPATINHIDGRNKNISKIK